jgi:hypothetical protein
MPLQNRKDQTYVTYYVTRVYLVGCSFQSKQNQPRTKTNQPRPTKNLVIILLSPPKDDNYVLKYSVLYNYSSDSLNKNLYRNNI